MSDLANRMKDNYELRDRHMLHRRTPVIVRVDGRAFHSYTRGMKKPFDIHLVNSMCLAARRVAIEMQGCKAAYIQSDEASFLLTDYDRFNTNAWFGYNKSKVESIAASVMTAAFNRLMRMDGKDRDDAHFDARAFNMPREEVSNYFLWRARDWERNSVAMYCNRLYSHKQMHGKSKADQHEMIHNAGCNWATDLTPKMKNGTWLFTDGSRTDILPTYSDISKVLDQFIYCDKEQV